MYYKFWLSLRKLQTKSQFRHYITIPFFHLLDIRHLRFLLRLHTWFHFLIYSSVIIRNQLWPHPTPAKTIWINLNQSYQRMLPYKFELFKRTGFWEDFLKVLSMYSYVKPPIVDLPCPMIWKAWTYPTWWCSRKSDRFSGWSVLRRFLMWIEDILEQIEKLIHASEPGHRNRVFIHTIRKGIHYYKRTSCPHNSHWPRRAMALFA